MGNRVYVTIKTEQTAETYYMHWNGGLDTWLPMAKALFDNEVSTLDQVKDFVCVHLGLYMESQGKFNPNLVEENGHYIISLQSKTFIHINSRSGLAPPIPYSAFKEAFENYLNEKILPIYRDNVRKEYWERIQEEAEKYFKKELDNGT